MMKMTNGREFERLFSNGDRGCPGVGSKVFVIHI